MSGTPFSFTHESVELHTRKGVNLDDFLTEALGFDTSTWNEKVVEWKLEETDEFKVVADAYPKHGIEVTRYDPFAKWGKFVIEKAKKKFPDQLNEVKLMLHALGRKVLEGNFGKRKPDIAGSDVSKDLLSWTNTLFVIEFKVDPAEDPLVPKDDDDDALVMEEKATGSKRSRAGQSGSASKKAKTRIQSHQSGSRSKAKTSSQRRVSSSRRAGSGSKKRNVPVVAGYYRPDTSSSKVGGSGQRAKPAANHSVKHAPEEDEFVADIAKSSEVQLANYAAQMISALEFREWVASILIEEDDLTLWYYDRAHAFCTEAVKFKTDHLSFIKIILALAEASSDKKRFGLERLYERVSPISAIGNETKSGPRLRRIRNIDFKRVKETINPTGDNEVPDIDLGKQIILQFDLNDNIYRQFTLFGRGTRVDGSIRIGTVALDGTLTTIPGDNELILKVSYQVKTRQKEHEIIAKAREVDRDHTPALLGYVVLDRDLPGARLEKKGAGRKPGKKDGYEERELVLLIMRKYQHAWELGSKNDSLVMDVYRQAVICHARLYFVGKILHRDLSLQNFMCYKSKDGKSWKAIVNDYDLAIVVDGKSTRTATSKHRTGTAPFMARQLLDPDAPEDITHIYAYELESWLYILLFIALGYTNKPRPKKHDILRGWRSEDWFKIFKEKIYFFNKGYKSAADKATKLRPRCSRCLRLLALLFREVNRSAEQNIDKMVVVAVEELDDEELDEDEESEDDSEDEEDEEDDSEDERVENENYKVVDWKTERDHLAAHITLQAFGEIIGIPRDTINQLTGNAKQQRLYGNVANGAKGRAFCTYPLSFSPTSAAFAAAIILDHQLWPQANTIRAEGTIPRAITPMKLQSEGEWPGFLRKSTSCPPLSRGTQRVLEVSYQVKARREEHESIAKARREVIRDHTLVPLALLGHTVLDMDIPRARLENLKRRADQRSLYGYEKIAPLFTRKYQHAWVLRNSDSLMVDVFRQAVVCHARLYFIGKILHRGLSLQNFMCYKMEDGTGWRAVINDYDFAIVSDGDGTQSATNQHRTGTAPFMARQLLNPDAPRGITHIYAYELESWLYILLYFALGYTMIYPPSDGDDILSRWGSPSWDIIFREKKLFFGDEYLESAAQVETPRPTCAQYLKDLVDQSQSDDEIENLDGRSRGGNLTLDKIKKTLGGIGRWEIERKHLIEDITLQAIGKIIGIPEDIINQLTGSGKQQ